MTEFTMFPPRSGIRNYWLTQRINEVRNFDSFTTQELEKLFLNLNWNEKASDVLWDELNKRWYNEYRESPGYYRQTLLEIV
jgi:hypothetical protein